jgi:hypothetical protein
MARLPRKMGANSLMHSGILFDRNRIKKVESNGHSAFYSYFNNTIYFWKTCDGTQVYEPIRDPVDANFFAYVKQHLFSQIKTTGYDDWWKVVDFFTIGDLEEIQKAKFMFTINKQ